MNARYFAAAMAALLASTTVGAQAGEVESVGLSYAGGNVIHVTLGITNGATTVNTAVVGPSANSMTLKMSGSVKCEKDKDVSFASSKIYFGSAFVFVDQVATTNTLYSADFSPAVTTWHGLAIGWLTEAGDNQDFVVPLNAVKAGAPLIRFDPVEEFNKRMQAHINNGGTKLDYMQNDHTFQVQRAVSMSGNCFRTKGQAGAQVKVAQTTVAIKVKYNGDPNLTNIAPIIGQSQPKGGFQAGYNPLTLTGGELIAFQPNYVGKCPAEVKFRVKMTGGGKGAVKIRVTEGGKTIHDSPSVAFANGEAIYEFTFDIPYEGKFSLNKKKDHDFRLYAKAKDEKEAFFPAAFQYYDQLTWHHTCTPTLKMGVGGQGGIQAGGGAQQMPSRGTVLKVQPVVPEPTPQLKVQPVNPEPTPTLKVAPRQVEPQSPQRAN